MYCPLAAADLGERRISACTSRRIASGRAPSFARSGADDAVLLLDEREQEVLGLDRLVALTVRQRLGGLDRLLRLDGQLVEAKRRHGVSTASWAIRARTDEVPWVSLRDPR